MTFLLRRLVRTLLQLVAVSALTFAFLELAPGDYLDEMKINPLISQQTLDSWREQFGLNQGILTRYFRWVRSVLSGDFGLSFTYAVPVSQLLWTRVLRTVQLSLCALFLTWATAVPLGVWCAARPRSWINRVTGGAASFLLAVPDLLAGLLVLAIAFSFGLGPVSGKLLPAALALACLSFPVVFRHTRSEMSRVLELPFIGHLTACGIGERRILFRHALPVASNPLISLFGLSLAGLTSSSLIVEVVLSWPGLGPLLLESILARDVAVVLAAVLLSSVLLLLGNFAADVALYAADPRIRVEDQER